MAINNYQTKPVPVSSSQHKPAVLHGFQKGKHACPNRVTHEHKIRPNYPCEKLVLIFLVLYVITARTTCWCQNAFRARYGFTGVSVIKKTHNV